MATRFCLKCGKMMDEKEFYMSRNTERYPDGKLDTCKACTTMHVDNWDPETYKWILQEIDVPYIKEEWDKLLEKWGTDPKKITGLTIVGRYLSKMKLKQWNLYRYADTEKLAAEALEKKVLSMKAQGLTGDEIEELLSVDRTPPKPKGISAPLQPVDAPTYEGPAYEEDEFDDSLTEEEKVRMRLKWGSSYRVSEWVRMELLYADMMKSYDIHGAGHKDTLIMICKASLKANQLIDAGDIEGFQKMSKVYDQLMKSGKFTAAQLKEQEEGALDSVGELVALCEKEGFIPRYYIDGPKDHVDRTLQDMQRYTKTLVTEELNLGNMLEAAVREIEVDRAREATIETDDTIADEEEKFEASLFADDNAETTDKDFEDFEAFKDSLRMLDEEEEEDLWP